MKLGYDAESLRHLGYVAFNNAFLDLSEENATDAKGLLQSDIVREFDLNYDSKKAYDQFVQLSNAENNYEALIVACSKMIEANNAVLLQQLKQLGVLGE